MLRNILLIVLAVAIAILGGAGSVWYALSSQRGIGALTIGAWTAYPELGSPDADPYSKARVAREGVLALGRAEGLIFTASTDSAGVGLRRECSYTVEGSLPLARFWTLFAADGAGTPLPPDGPRLAATHSQAVLRQAANAVSVSFSRHASPGNWVATSGVGHMTIVLTLYDTPAAATSGMAEIELPQVIRHHCDA